MSKASFSAKVLAPIELIVLQGTSFCNLNCTYCDLSVQSRRTKTAMAPELMERFFAEVFSSGRCAPEVTVLWHSGEPLTLPPEYYDDAIGRILTVRDRVAPEGVSVRFGIQTNGVLIDESWCRFFKRHADRLDVGISCDGPAELHDLFRVNWSGRATHRQTLAGMDLLLRSGIKYKIIAVITRNTLRQPEVFYRFFFDRRAEFSGFHFNILADGRSPDPNLAYSTEDRPLYYRFYRRLLELTSETGRAGDEFPILNFSQAFGRIVGSNRAGARSFFEEASAPLKALNLDTRGNVTTFYAGLSVETLPDAYGDGKGLSLGNVLETPLEEMVRSEKLARMMQDFGVSTRACEASCEYFAVCSGGFDLVKKHRTGTFDSTETSECVIHVKALADAMLDDIATHLELQGSGLPLPSECP